MAAEMLQKYIFIFNIFLSKKLYVFLFFSYENRYFYSIKKKNVFNEIFLFNDFR